MDSKKADKLLEDMHTNVSGLHALASTPERPWLNTIDNSTSITQGFTHQLLKRFAKIDGDAARTAFDEWLASECDRLNALWLGWQAGEQIDGYTRGLWNTPDQLGHYISIARGSDSELNKAVRDAFFSHAAEIFDVVTQHANDPIDMWGWKMDGAIETLANNLLGLREMDGEFVTG